MYNKSIIPEAKEFQSNKEVEFCRTCLAYSLKMRDIAGCNFVYMWEAMTGVKACELSNCSKMCENCEQVIERFHLFQKQSQQVEAILENYKIYNLTLSVENLKSERLKLFPENTEISSLVNTKKDMNIKMEHDDSSNSTLHDLSRDEPLQNYFKTAPLHMIKLEQEYNEFSESDNSLKKSLEKKRYKTRNKIAATGTAEVRKKREKRTFVIDKTKAIEIKLTIDEQIKEREDRRVTESYVNSAFKCEKCVLSFRLDYILKNHMEKHSETRGDLACDICEQRFWNIRQLRAHALIHAMRLQCLHCDRRLDNRARLVEHLEWHAGVTHTCSHCNKIFVNKSTMRNHIQNNHKLPEFTCSLCPGKFPTMWKLKEHEVRHKPTPPHACEICNKRFYSIVLLESHRNTHKTEKSHYCVECDRYFKHAVTLEAHLTRSSAHRDLSLKRFQCTQCKLRWESETLLAQHVNRAHAAVKEVACDQCPVTFSTMNGLRRHQRRTHEGVTLPKIHGCPTCDKSFSTKALLTNHIRVHTGERPFECEQCQRKFTQQSALQTHINLVHLKLKRTKKERDRVKAAEASIKIACQGNLSAVIANEKTNIVERSVIWQ